MAGPGERWSNNRERLGMLDVQEQLSTAIAEQVRLRLSTGLGRGSERRQTKNAAAYDEYSGDGTLKTGATRRRSRAPSSITDARLESIRPMRSPGRDSRTRSVVAP